MHVGGDFGSTVRLLLVYVLMLSQRLLNCLSTLITLGTMVRVSFRKVVPRCEDIEKGNTSNPASGSASRSDVSGAVNEDAQQIASANTSSDQHDTEGKRRKCTKKEGKNHHAAL